MKLRTAFCHFRIFLSVNDMSRKDLNKCQKTLIQVFRDNIISLITIIFNQSCTNYSQF